MNCTQSPDAIDQFANDYVRPPEAVNVARHVARCHSCSYRLVNFRLQRHLLRELALAEDASTRHGETVNVDPTP